VNATHVRLTDSTLRDGSHAMAHQFTEAQVRAVVHALDRGNVEVIEVAHGDGLGGSSFNYGFSRVSEFDLILAVEAGARQIDGALCALGAGAGNAPTEVLAATFDRLGIGTGVDVQGVLAAAQGVLRPMVPRIPFADRSAIVQGYAGVYSSFLLHAERASERYGVAAHEILQRVGEAGYVGGQEDMIIDIAIQLAQAN
jgi:isopropylmalate/homocitrate/citramalate synthase